MILVTGGTGLVGSHLLLELCKKETAIRALFRSKESIEKTRKVFVAYNAEESFAKISWFQADLLDYYALEEAFKDINLVYHAAAKVSFASKDEADLMRSNIDGTANMVNLALAKGIKKFAYVSSVASLGSYPNNRATDEEALWQMSKNTSAYSVSKYYAENEVWRGSEEGLPVVIVSPSTIIGYGDWNESSSTIIKKVYEGLKYYPSGGNGFVGVKDVVHVLTHLMESDIKSERYLLVSENLKFIELFRYIAKAFKKEEPKIAIPKSLAKLGLALIHLSKAVSGKKSMLNAQSVDTAYRIKKYSNQKAVNDLNYKFQTVEEAVQEACMKYSAFHAAIQ